MNYKQKLGYMALGAGILALGITIGQFITPDIEAQNNGVFDEIACRSLKVVNEFGMTGIELNAMKGGNRVIIYDLLANRAVGIASAFNSNSNYNENGIIVYNKGNTPAISLDAGKNHNTILLKTKEDESAISLYAGETGNGIGLFDTAGNYQWFKVAD